MSHLACAEISIIPLNAKQLGNLPRDRQACFSGVRASLSNSSAFSWRQFQFDVVRPEPASTASNPTPEADNPMQPVVDLKARIVQMRNIEKARASAMAEPGPRGGRPGSRSCRSGYADGYFRAVRQ